MAYNDRGTAERSSDGEPGRESGKAIDPAKLVAPMIERFMATDRGFAKFRQAGRSRSQPAGSAPPEAG